MTSFSKTKHPLLRDGRGQLERRLPALSPQSIELDGAALPEKLDFLLRLSRQVNHYDAQGNRSDWTAFFEQAIPFQIARISRFDVQAAALRFQELKAEFQENPMPEQVTLMMDFVLDLFNQIELWRADLPDDAGMGRFIYSLVESNLRLALQQFISLANAASGQWSYSPSRNLFDFQSSWQLSVTDYLAVEPAVAQRRSADRYRLDFAAQRLEELFMICQKALQEIVAEAPRLLQESLTAHQSHEPHLGLLYAFLEMLGDRKADLEKLTAVHLDFFYKEVLGINREKAVPDQAHLVFQLAKNFRQEVVPKGTLFKSGLKDSLGADVLYRLQKEVVVDQALVASLRTLYLDLNLRKQTAAMAEKPSNLVKGIFMAPVANSMDGKGEGFQTDLASWETLGEKSSKKLLLSPTGDVLGTAQHPFANLGILLAGDVFLAKEGTRTVTLKLTCDKASLEKEFEVNPLLQPPVFAGFSAFFAAFATAISSRFALTAKTKKSLEDAGLASLILTEHENIWKNGSVNFQNDILNSPLGNASYSAAHKTNLLKYADRRHIFQVWFTGEKEWVSPAEVEISVEDNQPDSDHFQLKIEILLDPAQPAVLNFNPEAHIFPAGVAAPAWKLLFNHEFPPVEQDLPTSNPLAGEASLYHFFRFLQVSAVNTTVDVQQLKGVILQNEVGVLDVKKPFQPFGASPKVDTEFFIGSKEVFQKDLKKLDFEMTWEGVPPSFAQHYQGYRLPARIPGKDDFSADVDLLQDNVWKPKFSKEPLFELDNGEDKFKVDFALSATAPLKGRKIPQELTVFDANSTNGFLRLALNEPNLPPPSDLLKQSVFFHSEYPGALARQMMAKAIIANGGVMPEAITYTNASGTTNFKVLSEVMLGEIMPALASLIVSYNQNIGSIENPANWVIPVINNALVTDIKTDYTSIKTGTEDINSNFASLTQAQLDTKSNSVLTSLNNIIARLGAFAPLASGPAVQAANDLKSTATAFRTLFAVFEECIDKYVNNQVITPIPLEPYTPTAKNFILNYCAQATLSELNQSQLDLYHLHPFEKTYLHHDWSKGNPTLLPYFEDQGTLYIGLKNLTPGGGLNLLFQLAESTADADGDRACIQWSYLVGNEWKPLRTGFNVLADATDGLLADGIVEFSIPWDADATHTIMPADGGMFWIKAAASHRAEAVSETLGVFAQAGLVAFAADLGTGDAHLAQPIAPKLIAKPAENIAFLQKIEQPYPSFDGKLAEPEADFHRRVSERLRHKGRAITLFDWESLVLHHFPEVYKAKCITHTLGKREKLDGRPQDVHQAPGFVTVAVIPDLTGLPPSDLLEPKLSLATLEKIEDFLKKRCSPFVRVRVLNPAYEKVKVVATVQFQPGRNEAFYTNQLKKDLLGFLSPWTSAGESDRLNFGGTVFRSVLLEFVESREYVDFVTLFQMQNTQGADLAEIAADSARSILISGEHVFTSGGCTPSVRPAFMKGVGYSALESTFKIH